MVPLIATFYFSLKMTRGELGFAAYAFVFSYAVLFVMQKFMPVKTSSADEKSGLDLALHGEEAYI